MDDMVTAEEKKTNRELCERFPFLIPWNRFSGKLITDCAAGDKGYWPGNQDAIPEYDYEYTELDDMPGGWRKAFGKQMCEELREALTEDGDLERWKIVQMKEKYGALRLYDNGYKEGSRIPDIIAKYERLSERTCVACGRPATKISMGWICPWCDDCRRDGACVPINEWFKEEDTVEQRDSGE